VNDKGKKRFVIKEKDGPQVSAGAAKKALLFAMVCIAGYIVASGSLTNQKDIKAHLNHVVCCHLVCSRAGGWNHVYVRIA
jgi:hypothetical protein